MTDIVFRVRRVAKFLNRRDRSIPAQVRREVEVIVDRVRTGNETALREYASDFGELREEQPLFLGPKDLEVQLDRLSPDDRDRLARISGRIREFAKLQLAALSPVETRVEGCAMGHRIDPLERAGCYAPGGRYPLPSSVLMTAVTARAAGVESVWIASPRPSMLTLAAASVAGADGLLAAGGAHAIAALAFGAGPVPPSDIVVGPGNVYVTAAKQYIGGHVRIDMLAGPSELVIMADGSADPGWIAAELLAQAEHDPDVVPLLITTDSRLPAAVESELRRQLGDLPTAGTARQALRNGGAILCASVWEAAHTSDSIAPEHLHLCVEDVDAVLTALHHYGCVFIGPASSEVLGDYGVGPNHVLPTGGTARTRGGLSILDFLRVRTWIRADRPALSQTLLDDVAWLARQEGLEAHARSAARLSTSGGVPASIRPRSEPG